MKKKIVTIGGGHGLATLLRGLKQLDGIDLTAVVAVSDSGGSTGRLRDIFNVPAIGDIRNVMTALAQEETMFQFLMDYRFQNGLDQNVDVLGHNLGNLILVALMDRMGGNLNEAIAAMSRVLNVKGQVVPSSLEKISLYAKMADGVIVKGEANIPNFHNQIERVFFDHEVKASYLAVQAIQEADLIVLGIGSLFTSILPNLIIKDIACAINQSNAKVVYYSNVMTELGETDDYSLEDHVEMIAKHGVRVDAVIMSSDVLPQSIVDIYERNNQRPVLMKQEVHDYQIIQKNLLMFANEQVRHHPMKIRDSFLNILDELGC